MTLNLNARQIIAIVVAVLSVLMSSTAQVTDLFGPGTAKMIISLAGLGTSVLSAVLAVITSQSSTLKNVLDMPGIENIEVNDHANKTLSQMAVDPLVSKISPTAAAMDAVTKTAHS